MGIKYCDPIAVSLAQTGAWEDVDLDDYIPGLGTNVTGVILRFYNSSGSTAYGVGARKNGSTDDRHDSLGAPRINFASVGVDSSHIFEVYREEADIACFIQGYYTEGVTFFTNGILKNPAGYNEYEDVDCSSEAPGAKGLIFEVVSGSGDVHWGARKNGSTDDFISTPLSIHSLFNLVVGCDDAQIVELRKGWNLGTYFYLLGYITRGAVFNTNATDMSLGSTGSYVDLSPLPSGATGGIFLAIVDDGNPYSVNIRKNGSSSDIYHTARNACMLIACDESQLCEGKIQSTHMDFKLLGYSIEEGAGTRRRPIVPFYF
jgi:hypothetical protein